MYTYTYIQTYILVYLALYRLVQAEVNKFSKRRKSTPFLDVDLEICTCSVSPCRPVNERCHTSCFFRQIIVRLKYIHVHIPGIDLSLKESKIIGEKTKTKMDTCAKYLGSV